MVLAPCHLHPFRDTVFALTLALATTGSLASSHWQGQAEEVHAHLQPLTPGGTLDHDGGAGLSRTLPHPHPEPQTGRSARHALQSTPAARDEQGHQSKHARPKEYFGPDDKFPADFVFGVSRAPESAVDTVGAAAAAAAAPIALPPAASLGGIAESADAIAEVDGGVIANDTATVTAVATAAAGIEHAPLNAPDAPLAASAVTGRPGGAALGVGGGGSAGSAREMNGTGVIRAVTTTPGEGSGGASDGAEDTREARRVEVRRAAVAALGRSTIGMDGVIVSQTSRAVHTVENIEATNTAALTDDEAGTAGPATAPRAEDEDPLQALLSGASAALALDTAQDTTEDADGRKGSLRPGKSKTGQIRKARRVERAGGSEESETSTATTVKGERRMSKEISAGEGKEGNTGESGAAARNTGQEAAGRAQKQSGTTLETTSPSSSTSSSPSSTLASGAAAAREGKGRTYTHVRRGGAGVGAGWGPLALKTWWIRWAPAAVAATAGVAAGLLLIVVQVSCNALVKRRGVTHGGAGADDGDAGSGGDVPHGQTVRSGGAGGKAGAERAAVKGGKYRQWARPEARGLVSHQGAALSYGVV